MKRTPAATKLLSVLGLQPHHVAQSHLDLTEPIAGQMAAPLGMEIAVFMKRR
jgi:hypothetical protein